MLKVVPSLLLSVLLVGALVIDTSSACPYMLQKIDQVDSPAIETASSRHTARTLQQDDGFFVFVIFDRIIQFFVNIFNFLFGRGNDNDNNFVFNSTPFVGSIDDALTAAREDIIGFMDAPKFVRLAFHDCVGGQCDGCVDTSKPDNFGLDEPIQDLQPIVNKYAAKMTRADVWVLAGLTAAEVAQTAGRGGNNNPVVLFPMQYVNRASCDDPQGGPARILPSAHFHTNQNLAFFASNFGFNDEETVAIMGAHTLGRAVSENSGFDGRDGWDANPNRLDNQYYQVLLTGNQVDEDFQLELQNNDGTVFPDQFLWRRGTDNDDQFMLNVDMSLVFDLGNGLIVDPVTGEVGCTVSTCPASSLLGLTVEYSQNNQKWVEDFRDAFTKLTSVGCAGVCTQL